MAQQADSIHALEVQLADAGAAAENAGTQRDADVAAKGAELSQAQDTIRAFPSAFR